MLDLLQKIFYTSDAARESFVELCEEEYVQKVSQPLQGVERTQSSLLFSYFLANVEQDLVSQYYLYVESCWMSQSSINCSVLTNWPEFIFQLCIAKIILSLHGLPQLLALRWHLTRTFTRPFKAMTLLAIWNWDGRPLAPCTSITIRPLAWRWVAFWKIWPLIELSWHVWVDCMPWLEQRLGLKRQVSYIDPFNAQDWYFTSADSTFPLYHQHARLADIKLSCINHQ